MEVKLKFNEIDVKEEKEKTLVKVLMLKGEKGDKGDGDFNVIEDVKVNGTSLPVSDKAVNVPIPTNVSSFNNDSGYLIENNLQMVNTSDVENGSQITDATGYARLNKIYGDMLQSGTPTPDNPIDVEVVTGDTNLTITNSDNTASQELTLSLGNIELCKINNYQDYIYYANGKWYLHKEIEKYKFTSSTIINAVNGSSASTSIQSANGTYFIFLSEAHISNILNDKMVFNLGKYKYYSTITNNLTAQNNLDDNTFCMRQNTNDRIYFKSSSYAGLIGSEIAQELIGGELFYILANAVDTEINDDTLLENLNTIKNFTLYSNLTNFELSSNDLIPSLNITYAITNRDIYSKEEDDDRLNQAIKNLKLNETYISETETLILNIISEESEEI